MIKYAVEIGELESHGYRVMVTGKGESNPSTMYRVRKGARGRDSIIDEQGLLALVERERASRGRGCPAV
jgi:Fe-S cluster assembly iron-binding protein IscA